MTTGKGYTERDYSEALERLLHLGVIANNQRIYQRDNRAWVTGLGPVETCTNPCTNPAQSDALPGTDPEISH